MHASTDGTTSCRPEITAGVWHTLQHRGCGWPSACLVAGPPLEAQLPGRFKHRLSCKTHLPAAAAAKQPAVACNHVVVVLVCPALQLLGSAPPRKAEALQGRREEG